MKPNSPIFTNVILVFVSLLMTSCTGLSVKDDQIKVNLARISMIDSTLFEQRFNISIRVQNRNRTRLNIDGFSFDLSLNGKEFASGVSNIPVTIDPFSEALLSVDLTSNLFSLIRQIQSVDTIHKQPFRFDFRGTFYRSDSIFGIPFAESGEIELNQISK